MINQNRQVACPMKRVACGGKPAYVLTISDYLVACRQKSIKNTQNPIDKMLFYLMRVKKLIKHHFMRLGGEAD